MTKEDLRRIEWMVERAEIRIGGLLLIFAGHGEIGAVVFILPTLIEWLRDFLIARQLRKESA